jgi:glycerate kinase
MRAGLRVLAVPDSFKGTLSAVEVAEAIARGIEEAGGEADRCPAADGGEGTMAALGGEPRTAPAHDPLGRRIEAEYAELADGAAVVEVAAASGLTLVESGERDPEAASSAGSGELIAAAIRAGAETVLVAAGGSASTDGGAGAIAAIEAAGGIGGARLEVLCDVRTPFERAAATFAPQKGADPAAAKRLEQRLDELAATLPRDPRGVAMSGAAGGLAGGLWAAFGAELRPGAGFVLDRLGFDRRIAAAELAITGEGRLDAQSREGKLVGEVAARCHDASRPAHAIVGENGLGREEGARLGLASVIEAGDPGAISAAAAAIAG